jgi:hypothetical protein
VHRPPGKLASPPKMSRDGFEKMRVTMRPPRPSPRPGDGQRLAGIHDNGITPASACSNCHSAIPWIGQARIDFGFKDKLRPPRVGMAPRGEAQVVKEAKRATGVPSGLGSDLNALRRVRRRR